MPQASDEDRERYKLTFPDIGCEHAIAELERRGYTLTRDHAWELPKGQDFASDEELFWIGFLVDEWDFGWLAEPAATVQQQRFKAAHIAEQITTAWWDSPGIETREECVEYLAALVYAALYSHPESK